VTYGPCKTVPESCYHFVGFRSLADQRLANAVRVFRPPDFLHRRWDMRAQREIVPGDVVIFAQGEADQHPSRYNGDDEAYGQADRAEPSRCIRS
jgi:hypothetical protein